MEITGLISGLFVGIVIGLIARILVPSMQPIGCFVTVLIGVIGGGWWSIDRECSRLGLLAYIRYSDFDSYDPGCNRCRCL